MKQSKEIFKDTVLIHNEETGQTAYAPRFIFKPDYLAKRESDHYGRQCVRMPYAIYRRAERVAASALHRMCKAKGNVYHHYAEQYKTLGRRKARALPSDSGVQWWYFVGISEELVNAFFVSQGIGEVRVNSSHDCSGQHFSSAVRLHTVGNRTLATISWGTDI